MSYRQIFHSAIEGSSASTDHRLSCLVDAHHQCAYPEIPARLRAIRRFLEHNDVGNADCVVVELNNSLRAALSVLALLDGGYSFLTLPMAGQGARAGTNTVAYPAFARWIVSVSAASEATNLSEPSTFLRVEPNPQFRPAAVFPESDDPRLFFKTSGSLGTAKLAMHRYSRFYRNMLNALERRQFKPTHRIALPTPIFHLYGLGAALLPALVGGASIDLQERSNILKYLEREDAFDPNVAYVTPAFCEMLVRGRRKPRRYEFLVTSGDRISDSTFRRCEDLHGPMVNQYGTTEMGMVSASQLSMTYNQRCQTVGSPVNGVELRIVKIPTGSGTDSDAGELQIRHAYGFEGYVDLDGNTLVPQTAFDGDWYRTGDLATLSAAGTLMVLGRCDLSVNRNGVLLPLADVESRMRELDGIDEVAVAIGSETIRGRALVAFCVASRGRSITGPQLRAAFAQMAPSFAVPDVVHVLRALPKLESGKVDRRALAKIAEEESIANGTF